MRVAGMALVGVAAGCRGLAPAAAVDPADGAQGAVLTVLTYNLNFERFDPATVDAVAAADADLVLLQETTVPWEQALRARLGERYPAMIFSPREPDGGMAVLSRAPVALRARLDSPVGAFPATCLEVDAPGGPLRVLHVHLHPPLDAGGLLTGYFTTGGYRDTEIEAHLACFGDPPDLLVGDFNEERGAAVSRVEAAGLRDAASDPPERTWRMDSRWGELSGRPDHVFHGPGLAAVEARVMPGGASDHLPLRVTLRRTAP